MTSIEIKEKYKPIREERDRLSMEASKLEKEFERVRSEELRAMGLRKGNFLFFEDRGYVISSINIHIDSERIGLTQVTQLGSVPQNKNLGFYYSDKEMNPLSLKDIPTFTPEEWKIEWAARKNAKTLQYQKNEKGRGWTAIDEATLRSELKPHYFDIELAMKTIKKSIVKTPDAQYRSIKA